MGWHGRRTYFTGYRDPTVWKELGLIGDRLSFTDDEVITKLGIGYITHVDAECAMDTVVRYELLNAGVDGEITAKQMLNHRTRLAALFEAGIVADGWYFNEEEKLSRDWVFDEEYKQLHQNHVSSGYNYNDAQFPADIVRGSNYYDYYLTQKHGWTTYLGWRREKVYEISQGNKIVTKQFSGNERELYNVLDDKVVLRYINKALNRMVKSEKAIQLTQGRGRTFRWDSWGWLDNIRSRFMSSEAKKRKIGDEVNGWIYTRGNADEYYGVTIYDHWWQPIEEVTYYKVHAKTISVVFEGPSWYTNYAVKMNTKDKEIKLPYVFLTEEDAQNYATLLNECVSNITPNAIPISKNITPDFDILTDEIEYVVKSYTPKITVSCDEVIEEYDDPISSWKELCLKGIGGYKLNKDRYRDIPKPITRIEKIEKESETNE